MSFRKAPFIKTLKKLRGRKAFIGGEWERSDIISV
jgi:hypothetical protein